jgi:hypothetical protein
MKWFITKIVSSRYVSAILSNQTAIELVAFMSATVL